MPIPAVTKQARRLYVGNLPVGVGLTEASLVEFFTQAVQSFGITTIKPVLSVWISADSTFCVSLILLLNVLFSVADHRTLPQFLEMRSVADAAAVLNVLQGVTLGGRQLRVGRPADFKSAPPHLANYSVPLGAEEAKSPAGSSNNGSSVIPPNLGPSLPLTGVPLLGPLIPLKTTKVVMLSNILEVEDLVDDSEYEDIVLDMKDECGKFGALEEVVIPRPNKDPKQGELENERVTKGVGKVFLRYQTTEAAEAAVRGLHGRSFNDKRVEATFFAEDKFADRNLA